MAAVLVTSKKKAIVVPGSTPPKNQELVPLHIAYCKLNIMKVQFSRKILT